MDGARSLTGARYGAITTIDDAGEFQHLVPSGMTEEEQLGMIATPDGWGIFRFLSGLREPVRTRDCVEYLAAAGFQGFRLPVGAFLGMQIREGERELAEGGGIELSELEEMLARDRAARE